MTVPRSPLAWLRCHALLADVGLAAVVLVLSLLSLTAEVPSEEAVRDSDALAVLLSVLITAPLALRRPYPHLTTVLVTVPAVLFNLLQYFGAAGGLALLVLLYSLAAHCTLKSALRWGLIAFVPQAASVLWAQSIGPSDWASSVVIFVTAFVVGRNLRTRRAYTEALETRAERAESERVAAALAAVSDERRRIARELHDVVAHNISVISVLATGARRTLDRDPARVAEVLETIEITGRDTLREMRHLLAVLRTDDEPDSAAPVGLEPQPGVAALPQLVDQVREAGLPVSLTVEGPGRPLAPGVELSAYRIVQEALTNTLKHAGPARATVVVTYGEHSLEVRVSDDGRGPLADAPAPASGHGLVGMRERVALYGGALRAGPRSGGGYEVVATLPAEPATTAVSR